MSDGVLHITDSRTSRAYQIRTRRNVIRAVDFQAIKGPVENSDLADQVGSGLRLFDPGFKKTTVSESVITYIYNLGYCCYLLVSTKPLFSDGSQGIVQHRGHSITDF